MLQKMQGKSEFVVEGVPAPLASIEILKEENRAGTNSSSELRSIRVRIRCPFRTEIKEIEKSLSELTIPSMESEECREFTAQLNKQRWLLESSMHSLKRLELDCEHDKFAIETSDTDEEIADHQPESSTSVESESSSPFRLTSFGSRGSSLQSQSIMIENLRNQIQVRSENLDSMNQTLDRLKAKSRGFLSLTGSPLLEPVVRPITGSRLFVLFLLCAAVWLILMFWLNPSWSRVLARTKSQPKQSQPKKSRSKVTATSPFAPGQSVARLNNNVANVASMDKTIQWMRRQGIPYLGEVQVFVDESTRTNIASTLQSPPMPAQSSQHPAFAKQMTVDSSVGISDAALNWLRSLSEGSLVLWIGLFAARFMFDPAWRELVAMAPLAAITRMISGIQ